MGLTINNMNNFILLVPSGLKPNSDKTVTNPSLKAGVSGYASYRGFSPDSVCTEPVEVPDLQSVGQQTLQIVYYQSLSAR